MRKPLVVVDASVALAWYLPDSDANLTYAIDVRDAQPAAHRLAVSRSAGSTRSAAK